MGLFKKFKDILFDEEEYTEQIKITPEMRNEDIEKVEKVQHTITKEPVEQPKQQSSQSVQQRQNINTNNLSDRELFNNDSTFPFFDFDENEFNDQKPIAKEPVKQAAERKPQFDYERKRKVEKRTDYGRYEKTEITETIERKKFKPSPNISPVYGILNKDYVQSDIVQREEKVDIQSVRDKAFGEKKTEANITPAQIKPKPTFYEETETVTISEPEEQQKKVKTIDELLEDTSDVIVDIDRDLDDEVDFMDFQNDSVEEPVKEQSHEDIPEEDDTLENDLFDLIDSMYDNKEDGE